MAMTLRLTDEQDAMLTRVAQREGISKHEAVIRALKSRAVEGDRHEEIRAATREIVEDYGPLLDRLAE